MYHELLPYARQINQLDKIVKRKSEMSKVLITSKFLKLF